MIMLLRGKAQSTYGDGVMQATQVIPTVWPMIFSAILGGMLKNLAHRKTQDGARLGLIEHLMASQTVFGALKAAWQFDIFSIATLILIPLWALSPIGGQAALRSLSLPDSASAQTTTDFSYLTLDPRVLLPFDGVPGQTLLDSLAIGPQVLFGTALYSTAASLHHLNNTPEQADFDRIVESLGGPAGAIQFSARDTWGRPRLPIMDLLPGYDEDSTDWLDAPQDRVLSYSSAFGIPFLGLPSQDAGNASFTMASAYTAFTCDERWMESGEFDAYLNSSRPYFQIKESTQNLVGSNEHVHHFQTTMPFAMAGGEYSDRTARGPNSTRCDVPERPLLFGRLENILGYGITCYPRVVYVDAEIQCSRGSASGQLQCATLRIRRSQDESHLCPSITEIDMMNETGYDPLNYMLGIFVTSEDLYLPSPAQQFLLNPAGVFKYPGAPPILEGMIDGDFRGMDPPKFTAVPPPVLQSRLTMLWNTWWMATKDIGLLSGFELNTYPLRTGLGSGRDSPVLLNETATWSYQIPPSYEVHLGWAVAFLAADAALFIVALYALWVKLRTDIPEILGYVSSLTRDSPYVSYPVPSPGSTLDGTERARKLKDAWIRMEDVNRHNLEVGRLALTVTGDSSTPVAALEKRRVYE